MNTVPIVVVPEVEQFLFKITGIPERNVIKTLPPNCPNEALDEGIREWYIGHSFHLRDLTNPQIRLPAVELKQRIVIAAEIVRACFLAGYRVGGELLIMTVIPHYFAIRHPQVRTDHQQVCLGRRLLSAATG